MNKIVFLSIVGFLFSMSAVTHAEEDVIPVPGAEENVIATSTLEEITPPPQEPLSLLPVSITLEIYTEDRTLYRDEIEVTSCPQFPDDTGERITGYCAIEQSGITAAWSWYGNDAFIDSLGGASNNYETSAYWNWFSDLTYGMTALNVHELEDGEHLLITLDRFPLQLVVPDDLVVGSTTPIEVLQFGFDMNFNPIWEPALESTIFIEGIAYPTDETGRILYTPLSTEELTFEAQKDEYLDADPVSTSPNEAATEHTVTSGKGGSSSPKNPTESAIAFLRTHQREDGSFANPLLSDWAALALKSAKESTQSVKNYLVQDLKDLKTATDFERRAMALAALGVNPNEYVQKIVSFFDGTQIGDGGLINDDIFALLIFSHIGYGDDDPMVRTIVKFLLAAQESDGGWESTDLTAAAIQSLTPYSSLPDVTSALSRARDFFVSHQQADGCFGNSFTTSWSVMAIIALDELPESWRSSQGESPLECLESMQGQDGGFEEGASDDVRVWATAYAIPALEGDTWHTLLGQYKKGSPSSDAETYDSSQSLIDAESTATTTESVPALALVEMISVPKEKIITHAVSSTLTPSLAATAILAPGVEEAQTNIWARIEDWITSLLHHIQRFLTAFVK
ncbi:MAG: prenyltransferase/squalene oxidase repeat-containing protein [Patescibacteria group bacterium]